MTVSLTNRLLMSKPDNAEFIAVSLLNGNWDKADSDFRPAAQMLANVNQTITNNTTVQVQYNVTGYDSYAARSEGAMVNLGTDTITIRKAGLYYVFCNAHFAAGATGTRRLQIAKNGTNLTPHQEPSPSSGASNSMPIMEPIVCAVNDTITANCFHTQGANLDLTNLGFSDGNYLAVIWAGSIT